MKRILAVEPLAVSPMTSRRIAVIVALLLALQNPAALLAQVAPETYPPASSAELAPASPPVKLPAPGAPAESEKKPVGSPSILPLVGSLILVLGLFFALAWAMRRMSPLGAGLLPAEAFELLGRAPLANRQQANLIRCGNKLLLISVGAAGAVTLAEITDPAEVERLTILCRQARPAAAATAFRRAFRQKGKNDG